MQWALTKPPSGTLERRRVSQRRLIRLWGDHPDGYLLPPTPQQPPGWPEPTAFYEVRTYPHNVLWSPKSEDALEALVDQGKPVVALREVWSRPSQVYHLEPEQHEQAVEEVGAALGDGVGHDPHSITPLLSQRPSRHMPSDSARVLLRLY